MSARLKTQEEHHAAHSEAGMHVNAMQRMKNALILGSMNMQSKASPILLTITSD